MSTATTTDSADFYALEDLLDAGEQAYLHSGRDVMASEVEPTVNRHWQRGSFPFEIVPGFRQLGLAGLPYHGFGCPGKSFLLDGMVTMELARTDPSIATFAAVHGGLAMGSIYLCGSEDQKQRYLPAMARYEKIGAFGLTEPDVGSGASRDLTTTARRDGDSWVLTGQKKWIGNATFGDLTVIWAGMKSVGTPSGCQAAVTATEGRVWPQWFPGAPPSNSTGEHPASCGVDFAFVGGRLCERVNISEVDFEWVPAPTPLDRRRGAGTSASAHDADLLSPRRRHARHVCRHPSAGHTRPELSQIHWAGRAPDLIGWRCRRKTKGNA